MKTAHVQKTITFPAEVYELVVSKAKQLGLSFSEYVKHLSLRIR